MLTAVLDRLTTLTSKHFIIGAFVPVLLFGVVNGLLLYTQFGWFRGWADPQRSGTGMAFDAALVLAGLAVAAYVLWSVNAFLTQTLEGQHLPSGSAFVRSLREAQSARVRRLTEELRTSRDMVRRIAAMPAALSSSTQKGLTSPKNDYNGSSGDAAAALKTLRELRASASTMTLAVLDDAVKKFAAALAVNNVGLAPPGENQSILSRDWQEMLALLEYAEDDWRGREVSAVNRRQARFGTTTVPAPTAFGNVVEAMQSYALTRYRINLATFWSRLQPILQKHTEFYAALQDAKVQLDFLVALVWLSGLTSAIWLPILPFSSASPWLFAVVALGGPLVTRVCYVSAVENHVAFSEIVRTAIDLYRFELLDQLHLTRPTGLRHERVMWEALQGVTSYGLEWVDLSYRATPQNKT